MLPLASTLAQLVAIGKPTAVGRAVPGLMNAQPPRMPFSFFAVVVMLPEPPVTEGGVKTATPRKSESPLAAGASAPRFKFAVPPAALLARIKAGPISIVVPLKVWELVVAALPFITSEA